MSAAADKAALLARVMVRIVRDLKAKSYDQFVAAYSNPGHEPDAFERRDREINFTLTFSKTCWYDVHAEFNSPIGPWVTAAGAGDDLGVFITASEEGAIDVDVHLAAERLPGRDAHSVIRALKRAPGFGAFKEIEAPLKQVPEGPASLMTPAQHRVRAAELRAQPSAKAKELAEQHEVVAQMLERRASPAGQKLTQTPPTEPPPALAKPRLTERLTTAAIAPVLVLWYFAGPITYVVAVVDTWHSRASVPVKLLLNLTLDAFEAAIWPIIWPIWIVEYLAGLPSPLRILFG